MIKTIIKKLLEPRTFTDDSRRKEFILNVLLLASISLFAIATIFDMIAAILRPVSHQNSSIAPLALCSIVLFLSGLYVLSRKGHFRVSAYILLGTFFILSFYISIEWGVDVSASLLMYALCIVMAGILINTRAAFVMTSIVVISMLIVGDFQNTGLLPVNHYWRGEQWGKNDTIMTGVIFLTIATVSWLSNREIEKSLFRARKSEAMLMKERDMLEITVEERTKELRGAQMEQIAQLYRFAEFGRLSSGLFHDLVNPLTAVSLNVERALKEKGDMGDLTNARRYLDQAMSASKRMERFIMAVRKQILKQDKKKIFSVTEEIQQVIDILSHKAHMSHVAIHCDFKTEACELFGDSVRFSQVALNLITNAIDAYDDIDRNSKRDVFISISNDATTVTFSVRDNGIGIQEENLTKIFDPFFTTKYGQSTKGTGIGLSVSKRIVEKDFNGEIYVRSTEALGTVFTVRFLKTI